MEPYRGPRRNEADYSTDEEPDYSDTPVCTNSIPEFRFLRENKQSAPNPVVANDNNFAMESALRPRKRKYTKSTADLQTNLRTAKVSKPYPGVQGQAEMDSVASYIQMFRHYIQHQNTQVVRPVVPAVSTSCPVVPVRSASHVGQQSHYAFAHTVTLPPNYLSKPIHEEMLTNVFSSKEEEKDKK